MFNHLRLHPSPRPLQKSLHSGRVSFRWRFSPETVRPFLSWKPQQASPASEALGCGSVTVYFVCAMVRVSSVGLSGGPLHCSARGVLSARRSAATCLACKEVHSYVSGTRGNRVAPPLAGTARAFGQSKAKERRSPCPLLLQARNFYVTICVFCLRMNCRSWSRWPCEPILSRRRTSGGLCKGMTSLWRSPRPTHTTS